MSDGIAVSAHVKKQEPNGFFFTRYVRKVPELGFVCFRIHLHQTLHPAQGRAVSGACPGDILHGPGIHLGWDRDRGQSITRSPCTHSFTLIPTSGQFRVDHLSWAGYHRDDKRKTKEPRHLIQTCKDLTLKGVYVVYSRCYGDELFWKESPVSAFINSTQ